MNLFKSKILTWWEVGALKLALFLLGLAIGALWSDVFYPYIPYLVFVGCMLGVYVGYVWFKE